MGGTGYQPVSPGYQPGEMEERVCLQASVRLSEMRPTRSGRLVANQHRQVACATHFKCRHYRDSGRVLFMGGTGNLPVSPGYQPGEMGERVYLQASADCSVTG